jgi:hypothetical protein
VPFLGKITSAFKPSSKTITTHLPNSQPTNITTTMSSVLCSSYKVPFFEAVKIRRSTIPLAKESPISDERIVMIVNHAIKHAPSPFSVQSCRAIVLFGADHEKLWDIGFVEMEKTMPPSIFANYVDKITSHKNSYGTVNPPQSLHPSDKC